MYDVSLIKSGLIGLVGWRQNVDPTGQQLSTLTASSSGLYFNDEHPMLTLDNLLSIAPDFGRLAYTAWSSLTTYAIGDKVSLSGVNYIAIAASTNQTPPNSTYWISAFTQWLKEKTEAGIIKGLNAWMDEKFEDRTARNLLSNSVLFAATGHLAEVDTNNGQVVGMEILPVISRSLAITVNRIGLQFDTNQGITISLFNSRQPTAIASETITYAGSGGIQWEDVEWALDGEGAYYLVYDQSDITGQSINGVHEYHFQTYGRYGRTSFSMGKYFRSTSFSVGGDVSGLWDISSNSYTLETNYGLNLDISVECDYTNLFLEQKNQFKTVIAKSVACLLLHELIHNPNSNVNRNQTNADAKRRELLYDLNGDSEGEHKGLGGQLERAICGAKMDTTGMDKVCLPCKRWASKWRVA